MDLKCSFINILINSICLLVLVSCDSKYNEIEKIYENKDDLVQTFKNTGIIERGDAIYFRIYAEDCDTLVNNYVFVRDKESINFVSSRLKFELDKISILNSPQKYNIQDYLSLCLKKMRNYGINCIGSDFRHLGITTIFYLTDALVIYVLDKTKVTNESWVSCLKRSNKLDEYWYWISLEDYMENK